MGKRGQEAAERKVVYFYLESRKMSNEQKEDEEQTGCLGAGGGRRFPYGMIHCLFKKHHSLKFLVVSTDRDNGARQQARPGQARFLLLYTHSAAHTEGRDTLGCW